MLISSMVIFGTIGILRKFIPQTSAFVALVRALIGTVFLLTVVLAKRQPVNWKNIRSRWIPLLLSGVALGFNWILLFESYNHTSVATATLCYYLAPILVILASPFVLKEKLTCRKALCAIIALAGMVLVSGITQCGYIGLTDLTGILYGLSAAVLYAAVMLLNNRLSGIGAYDKTILQLGIAACALLPYVLLTEDVSAITVTSAEAILLLIAGVIHTGIAYWLYFGAIPNLKGQTVALYSYLDPILAIGLSMIVLKEPMTAEAAIGAVLILGAAFTSET